MRYITAVIAGYPAEDMYNKRMDVRSGGGRNGQIYFRNCGDVLDPAETWDRIEGVAALALRKVALLDYKSDPLLC